MEPRDVRNDRRICKRVDVAREISARSRRFLDPGQQLLMCLTDSTTYPDSSPRAVTSRSYSARFGMGVFASSASRSSGLILRNRPRKAAGGRAVAGHMDGRSGILPMARAYADAPPARAGLSSAFPVGLAPPDPAGEWWLLGPPPDNSTGSPRLESEHRSALWLVSMASHKIACSDNSRRYGLRRSTRL